MGLPDGLEWRMGVLLCWGTGWGEKGYVAETERDDGMNVISFEDETIASQTTVPLHNNRI